MDITIHFLNHGIAAAALLSLILAMAGQTLSDPFARVLRLSGFLLLLGAVLAVLIQGYLSWDGRNWIEDGEVGVRIFGAVFLALSIAYHWLTRPDGFEDRVRGM